MSSDDRAPGLLVFVAVLLGIAVFFGIEGRRFWPLVGLLVVVPIAPMLIRENMKVLNASRRKGQRRIARRRYQEGAVEHPLDEDTEDGA